MAKAEKAMKQKVKKGAKSSKKEKVVEPDQYDEASTIDVDLYEFSKDNYYRYGTSVLEDRAIPDFRDGLNPVNRRLLWAAHTLGISSKVKFVKAARIIGETLGRYHPHSDVGCYDAMVGMTNVGKVVNNLPIGLFQGEGNWGGFTSHAAAAMRYTEARLSSFSDEVLFNKFYLPTVDFVPNFDSSTKEPLILPALLPVLLLNGRFGIAPGATTHIPAFEPLTVLKILKRAYSGKTINAKVLAKILRVTSTYGGIEDDTYADRKDLFKAKKGKALLTSDVKVDKTGRTFTVTAFAHNAMSGLLESFVGQKDVQHARDLSGVEDRYGVLEIQAKRSLKGKDLETFAKKLHASLSRRQNYVLNFTERYKDNTGQPAAKMSAKTLVQVIEEWVAWRKALEVRAAEYWAVEAAKDIRRQELMILAVDNREIIIKSLSRECTMEELYEWLAKKLKITRDEAAAIYELRIRQLRSMERKDLLKKKKEMELELKDLKNRAKKPFDYMLKQLPELRKSLQI